jgi:uncharacterized protein (TIGR02145 family)
MRRHRSTLRLDLGILVALGEVAMMLAIGCDDGGPESGPTDSQPDWAHPNDASTDLDAENPCILPDAGEDAASDTAGDRPGDVPVETGDDGSPCIVPDATSDAAPDTAEDSFGDVPVETGDVVPSDTAEDAAADPAEEQDLAEPDADADLPSDADLDLAVDPDADLTTDTDADEDSEPPPSCEVLVDSRDGSEYAAVQIGDQCWMAENLDIGTMIAGAGDNPQGQQDNDTIEKYCYDDDPAECAVHGGLYQWGELMDYSPSDADNPSTTQGICPEGWHVPSDMEWQALERELGMSEADAALSNVWRGVGVGTALKEGGGSGFEALMSGRRSTTVFQFIGSYTYHYTSTEDSTGANAWRRCLGASYDTVGRWDTFPKSYSFSLRCVRD